MKKLFGTVFVILALLPLILTVTMGPGQPIKKYLEWSSRMTQSQGAISSTDSLHAVYVRN